MKLKSRIHSADKPTSALTKFSKHFSSVQGTVLDVPSGSGRNAFWLRELGLDVVCLDRDKEALDFIDEKTSSESFLKDRGRITTVNCDLFEDHWPFPRAHFSATIKVDFFLMSLFEKINFSLKSDGLLFFHTFSNRGGNYLALPKTGEIHSLLSKDYVIEFAQERHAGPSDSNAVTVSLLARKK